MTRADRNSNVFVYSIRMPQDDIKVTLTFIYIYPLGPVEDKMYS